MLFYRYIIYIFLIIQEFGLVLYLGGLVQFTNPLALWLDFLENVSYTNYF